MVHNFDKYAGVDLLQISITLIDSNLKVLFKDTGKGFNPKHIARVNGLNNIKKRMSSIDLDTEIIAHENEGVQIFVSGNLENEHLSHFTAV